VYPSTTSPSPSYKIINQSIVTYFSVTLRVAPSSGENVGFIIYNNGSSVFTGSIADTTTSSYSTVNVPFSSGDLLSIKVTSSANAIAEDLTIQLGYIEYA
jgi:hypothetical protein